MDSDIERLDKKRMGFLALYQVGFEIFIILSVTRYFFRLRGLNSQPIGITDLIGLQLSLMLLGISTIGSLSLGRKIKRDPLLKEALYNELVRSL